MSEIDRFAPFTVDAFQKRVTESEARVVLAHKVLQVAQETEGRVQNGQAGVQQGGASQAREELLEAEREREELQARAECWTPGEQRSGAPRCASCRGEAADRRCLGCGRRYCPTCAPEGRAGKCPRCGGPVWRDGEALPPGKPNPQNRGY